jgi:hypothetical protein
MFTVVLTHSDWVRILKYRRRSCKLARFHCQLHFWMPYYCAPMDRVAAQRPLFLGKRSIAGDTLRADT